MLILSVEILDRHFFSTGWLLQHCHICSGSCLDVGTIHSIWVNTHTYFHPQPFASPAHCSISRKLGKWYKSLLSSTHLFQHCLPWRKRNVASQLHLPLKKQVNYIFNTFSIAICIGNVCFSLQEDFWWTLSIFSPHAFTTFTHVSITIFFHSQFFTHLYFW